MNYALGSSFNLDDLFLNFNNKKLTYNYKDCIKLNNDPHKEVLAKQIFKECVKLVLNDVIDNNITFKLPTGKMDADIHMRKIEGEKFSKARQNGKFEEIDFLNSYFTGYELSFNNNTRNKSKTIYVDKKLKNKIIDYTNSGKNYC